MYKIIIHSPEIYRNIMYSKKILHSNSSQYYILSNKGVQTTVLKYTFGCCYLGGGRRLKEGTKGPRGPEGPLSTLQELEGGARSAPNF